MKNSLDEILDKCSAEEVDIFMKDFEFKETENIPSEEIYKKALKKSGIAKKNIFRVIFLILPVNKHVLMDIIEDQELCSLLMELFQECVIMN